MSQDSLEIFQSNLDLLIQHHPINSDLINKVQKDAKPINETYASIPQQTLEVYEGVFLYGLQQGLWAKEFFPWLDANPKRRLVICESNPLIIANFLSQKNACELITKPRVHLIMIPNGMDESTNPMLVSIMNTLIMYLNLRNALFLEHPDVHDQTGKRKQSFEDAIEKALGDFYAHNAYLKGQNHKTLVNNFENLSMIQDSISILDLKDAFKGQPIVLCAAGFSLPKVYDKLKSIHNSTLIAAAGTGASLLLKNGIDCHFNAILDVSPSKKHTSYYHNHHGILFYLLRSGNQAVTQHQGLKVLCETYHMIEALNEQLKDKPKKENAGGMYWTVADFLLSQLIHLGFGPIYLVGLDHIMDKTKYYADDILKVDKNLCSEKMFVYTNNLKNEEVLTKFDWHQGTKKINELCKLHPEAKITYVSDEGLPIPNAITISTDKFNQLQFTNDGVCEDKYLPQLLKINPTVVSNRKLLEFIETRLLSFLNCKKLFEKIDIELGKNFFAWQITPIDALNPYTGVFFSLQKALSEEVAYKEYLLPTWEQFKTQIHIDAGFFGESTKAKLTLFALKSRELDFLKHQNMTYFNLFTLQKQQILERGKLYNINLEEVLDTHFHPVALPD